VLEAGLRLLDDVELGDGAPRVIAGTRR